jgi:hypothetical protein
MLCPPKLLCWRKSGVLRQAEWIALQSIAHPAILRMTAQAQKFPLASQRAFPWRMRVQQGNFRHVGWFYYLPVVRLVFPSRPAKICCSRLAQLWLPTVQLVLQALWQELWHSPQPP